MKGRALTIQTERLRLRQLETSDAERITLLASDERISDTAPSIPYPYRFEHAERWIRRSREDFRLGTRYNLAIVLLPDLELIGVVGLALDGTRKLGSLGYWIGVPYWGHGYATEAASGIVSWAFETLGLREVQASYLRRNPASGRVLRKLGMWYWRSTRDVVAGVDELVDHYVIGSEK